MGPSVVSLRPILSVHRCDLSTNVRDAVSAMAMFDKIIKEYGGLEELIDYVGAVKANQFCDSIYLQLCKQLNEASYLQNVQWKLRHYQAAKKIVLSALFYTETEYLISHKIKNICYYSMYYSLFNALSSNILLLPQLQFGNALKPSHADIFRYVENFIVKMGMYKPDVVDLLNQLRMMREIYSYHLPLGGSYSRANAELNVDSLFKDVTRILPIVLQVSNMVSYLSYYAWKKKGGAVVDEYEKYSREVDEVFSLIITTDDHLGKYSMMDDADYDRQGYFLRDVRPPSPIHWFINDKICEDLEGGWEEADGGGYDIYRVVMYLSDAIGA